MKTPAFLLRPTSVLGLLMLLGGASTPAVEPDGGGEYRPDRSVPCLTPEQRDAIQLRLDQSQRELQAAGKLPPRQPEQVSLRWPIHGQAPAFGYHGISAFVDLNPAFPNQLLDWNCGTRTYDTSSFNHRGIDIFSWPFGWQKMDESEVAILAAAPGVIIGKDDGNYDRNCASNSNMWNAVYVQHADGSTLWYGHMKNGSTSSRPVGSQVLGGEYLGIVGSSGSSSGPHLHFELHTAGGAVVEPHAGACNGTTASSWWAAQRPYDDSWINKLATHFAPPVFPACPTTETPNIRDTYAPGASPRFAAYYRDLLAGQTTAWSILRPDGSLYQTWNATAATSYLASYWYFTRVLPANAPEGQWRFRAVYNGTTFEERFLVTKKGDFNADGMVDLLFQNLASNQVQGWLMNGTSRTSSGFVTPDPPAGLQLVGADLFDGDQLSDLAFWNSASGAVEFWTMNGLNRVSAVPLSAAAPLPLEWRLQATGDFNHDGWPDLLWRNSSTAKLLIWTMNGTAWAGQITPFPDQAADANWTVVAALDLDGDANRDMLWYNSTSGKIVVWRMNASVQRISGDFSTPSNAGNNNWKVVAGGNYGIGLRGYTATQDIVWRNDTSGKLVVWHMDRNNIRTAGVFTSPDAPTGPLNWVVAGPR